MNNLIDNQSLQCTKFLRITKFEEQALHLEHKPTTLVCAKCVLWGKVLSIFFFSENYHRLSMQTL